MINNQWKDNKGNKISQSTQHKDLFLVTTPDGGWYSLYSTTDLMEQSHPPARKTNVKLPKQNLN